MKDKEEEEEEDSMDHDLQALIHTMLSYKSVVKTPKNGDTTHFFQYLKKIYVRDKIILFLSSLIYVRKLEQCTRIKGILRIYECQCLLYLIK